MAKLKFFIIGVGALGRHGGTGHGGTGSDLDFPITSFQNNTMTRPPRLHSPGLLYHVYSRGNNRQKIFMTEVDLKRFIVNLDRFKQRFNFKLYAFCLMPTHFHLLIEVSDVPLSKIMQVISTAYSMYFNKKYDFVGHVFQGRFKSIIVDKDEYLLQVVRYIHLNPVRARLVKHPGDFQWSSYNDYLGRAPSLVERQEVLNMISTSAAAQVRKFEDFSLAGVQEDFDPEKLSIRGVLGDQKFREFITKASGGVRP